MRRLIPSTAALVAFEASARHQSYTRAAEELSLTQSAVCRQIAGLEGLLGVPLFRRARRGVQLTAAGREYARKVARRLDGLEGDTLEAMAGGAQRAIVELAVVPTFATCWLLPRLPHFALGHPQTQVNLHTRTRPFLFDDSGLDAAIYAGDGHWPGCHTQRLFGERLIAVCSPRLLDGAAPDLHVSQLGRLPLLQQTTRPHAWRRWLAAAGVQVAGDLQGPRYELFSMSVQAAVLGMGVALVPDFMVRDELARGILVQPVPDAHDSDRAYHVVVPDRDTAAEPVLAFTAWLLQAARAPADTPAAP